ncbi:MAG: hypothetical protein KIT16_02205 [Rhodospirillaceae bacterium]|nr:hypothetical protein [Rhodospirillaceae bacterium]
MNPIANASMSTAVDFAREVAPEAPMILWPDDWPAPELVAWTLAHMLAETLPPGARFPHIEAPAEAGLKRADLPLATLKGPPPTALF